jgi:hypothetical protein
MSTYADLLAKRRNSNSGDKKAASNKKTTAKKTYAQILDERRGIKPTPTFAKEEKPPIMSTVKANEAAKKRIQAYAPAQNMSVAPKKKDEPLTFKGVPESMKVTGDTTLAYSPTKSSTKAVIEDTGQKPTLGYAVATAPSKLVAKAGSLFGRTTAAAGTAATKSAQFLTEAAVNNQGYWNPLHNPITKKMAKVFGQEEKLNAFNAKVDQYVLNPFKGATQGVNKRVMRMEETLDIEDPEGYQDLSFTGKLTKHPIHFLEKNLPGIAGTMSYYLASGGTGLVVTAASTANDVKQDAMAHGVKEQDAERLGAITGVVIGAIDKISLGSGSKVLARFQSPALQKVLGNTFVKHLVSIAGEGLGEITQEKIQIAAERTFKEVSQSEEQERLLTAGFLSMFTATGFEVASSAKNSLSSGQMPDGFDNVPKTKQDAFLSVLNEVNIVQSQGKPVPPELQAKYFEAANAVDESVQEAESAEMKAEVIYKAINEPITEESLDALEDAPPDMRLAFEQSMVDLNDANDPALEQSTREQGLVFKRVTEQNDPILKDFENLPVFYDPPTGQIVFNEAIIAKTLKHLADGKVIIVGAGKLVNSFIKKEGESLAELKTRYETELIKHEMAHVKTITQEDINLFEKLQAEGKTAEAQRLKVNLEERANKYTVENAKTAVDKDTADIIEKVVQREQNKSDSTQQMELNAYARSEKEDGYKAWRRMVSRETNLVNANFDEIQSYLGPKEANKRFEDALDRQDVVGGDTQFDELIASFQKRYAKESANKSKTKNTKEQGKEVAEAFKKLPERIKKAIASEIKAARKSGSTVDADTLRKRITERVLKAEQRHLERGPMRKRLQSIERTRTMKSIRKLVRAARTTRTLSGNKKAKISVDAQRLINGSKKDGILGIAKVLGMNRKKVLAQATQEMIDWREKNPEAIELPEAMAINIQIAKSAGIAQQTIRELRETEAFIKGIVEDGKADRLSVVEKIRERNTKLIESVKEHLTGEKNYQPEGLVRSDDKVKPSLKTGRGMFWGSAPVGDFARKLGKQAEKLFAKTVSASEQTKAHVNRTVAKVEAMGVDVYGGQKNYYKAVKKDASNVVNLGEFTNARGETKKLELSRLQAMGIYASRKDAKYLQNLTNEKGNAFTEEMIAASDSLLSKQDKEYITKVVDIAYKGQYKRFAEAVQQASGVDLGFTENYAGSIHYETNPEEDLENPAVDLINSSLQKHVTGLQNSAKKSRTNFIGEMKLSTNPIFDAIQYVASTEHFINMHDKIGQWEALLKDRNTREAMEKKVGKEFTFLLEQHIEDIRSGGLTSEKIDQAGKDINSLTGNISGALLTSFGVWGGQAASIFQFKAEAGIGSGFVDGIRKHKELLPILKKYAPAVDSRVMDNANQILAEISKDPTKINSVLSGIRKAQSLPLEFMDKITTLAGTLGMFEVKTRKYMKQGLTQEQAYEAAGRDVNLAIVNTQSTSSHLGKSYWEKRNQAIKLITGLRNQPNKMARATFGAIDKRRKGEITTAELIHFQVYASVIQPIAYTTIRFGVNYAVKAAKISLLYMAGTAAAKAIADDLEKEQQEELEKFFSGGFTPDGVINFLKAQAPGITSQALGFFAIGDLVNVLMANKFQGKNYEYRPAVITTVMQDAIDMLKLFTSSEGVNAWKTGLLKGLRAVSRSLGVGDPLGLIPIIQDAIKYDTAQIKKTPEYKRAQKIKKKEKALKEKEKARK